MPRLLIVNPGTDIAGVGIALKYAFDWHAPDWTAHHVRRLDGKYGYPSDQPWSELERLWRDADLVHVMDDPRILRKLPTRDNVFVHHLGSRFRSDPQGVGNLCREYGARQLSSLDLLAYPDIEWLPVPSDIDSYSFHKRHRGNETVRIAHAPTNRMLKSTQAFLDVTDRLYADGFPIERDLIEGAPHTECLERKAEADIYFDELTLGYGLNAIECWAMGIPVVSGMTVGREAALRSFTTVPWEDATADTLYDVLARLVDDPQLRVQVGQRGKDHVNRYHAPQAVVRRVLELAAP